jgi:hypothetical protein
MACGCKKSVKKVTEQALSEQAAREEVRRLRYGTSASGGAQQYEADLSKKEPAPAK